MRQIVTDTHLTTEQYAKGMQLELTVKDFIDKNGELNHKAWHEAQGNFTYLNMETYMKVETRFGHIVPFKLNRPQRYLMKCKLEQLQKYGYCRLIVLKPRQVGSSTFWSRDGFINAKFRNFKVAVVAHEKGSAGEKSLFKYAMDGYDDWVEFEEKGALPNGFTDVKYKTKEYMEFREGGRMQVFKGDLNAVSSTNQYIHISEASRIGGYADFMESILPSLPKGNHSTMVVESTARYTGGYFFQKWWEQWELEKQKGFPPVLRAIFLPCYMLEEYTTQPLPEGYGWDTFWEDREDLRRRNIDPSDLYGDEEKLIKKKWWDPLLEAYIILPLNFWYWRQLTIDEQEVDAGSGFTKFDWFRQNYPMTPEEAELIAGDSVFPRERVHALKQMVEAPIYQGDIIHVANNKFPIMIPNKRKFVYQEWDEPIAGLPYVIVLDPSNEREGDWSAAMVYSPKQKSFPAMLRMNGMVTTHDVVSRLVAMGWRWNTALIGWEANLSKIGDTILMKLLGKDFINPPGTPYPNLYTRMRFEGTKRKRKKKDPVYGFWTADNKSSVIQLWTDALYDPEFSIYSEELLNELWFMRQVVDNEGFKRKMPNAPKGKNDDIIMAGGIAMFIARELSDRPDLRKQLSCVKMSAKELAFSNYKNTIQEHFKSLDRDVRRKGKPMRY